MNLKIVSKKRVSKKRFQLKRKNMRISKIKRRTNKKVTKKRNKKTYKRRNKNTYKRRVNGGTTLEQGPGGTVVRISDRPGSADSGLQQPLPPEFRPLPPLPDSTPSSTKFSAGQNALRAIESIGENKNTMTQKSLRAANTKRGLTPQS